MNLAFGRRAKKVTLSGRAIMIVAADGATAVGGQCGSSGVALGESMKMTVEHGHEVEVPEAFQQIIGVQRAHRGEDAEREVGEDNRGSGMVQLAEIIIEPV